MRDCAIGAIGAIGALARLRRYELAALSARRAKPTKRARESDNLEIEASLRAKELSERPERSEGRERITRRGVPLSDNWLFRPIYIYIYILYIYVNIVHLGGDTDVLRFSPNFHLTFIPPRNEIISKETC